MIRRGKARKPMLEKRGEIRWPFVAGVGDAWTELNKERLRPTRKRHSRPFFWRPNATCDWIALVDAMRPEGLAADAVQLCSFFKELKSERAQKEKDLQP